MADKLNDHYKKLFPLNSCNAGSCFKGASVEEYANGDPYTFKVNIFVNDELQTSLYFKDEKTFIDEGITHAEKLLYIFYQHNNEWERIEKVHIPAKEIRFYKKEIIQVYWRLL